MSSLTSLPSGAATLNFWQNMAVSSWKVSKRSLFSFHVKNFCFMCWCCFVCLVWMFFCWFSYFSGEQVLVYHCVATILKILTSNCSISEEGDDSTLTSNADLARASPGQTLLPPPKALKAGGLPANLPSASRKWVGSKVVGFLHCVLSLCKASRFVQTWVPFGIWYSPEEIKNNVLLC